MQLSATRLSAIAHPGNRLPFNKFISALLSKSGRVAAYYGESWDEILAYNGAALGPELFGGPTGFTTSTRVAVTDMGGGRIRFTTTAVGNANVFQIGASHIGFFSSKLTLVSNPSNISIGIYARNQAFKPSGTALGGRIASGVATDSAEIFSLFFVSTEVGQFFEIEGISVKEIDLSKIVAFEDSAGAIPLLAPLGSGKGCGLLKDRSGGGNHRIQTSATARGEMSRRVNLLTGTETLATQSITTVATNSVLSFSGAGSITLSGAATGTYATGTHSITTTAGTLTLTVSGTVTQADCRYSAAAGIGKTYQRVTSASDYDEEGFPARWTLKTDDWAKSSINPAGANRAFVLTALRVNSSASLGVLAEYGPTAASTDGTFSLESLSSQITLRVRGASAGTTVSASVADSSYVVIGALIDLASPRQELFINGVSAGVSTAAIGSTTLAERDLFVGARNGTSAFADAGYTAPLMAVFMQPGDPGLTSAEIARLTRQFNKSIKAF